MKNNRLYYFIGLLTLTFCVCLVSGCATTSLVSNKSDRPKGPYKKIFIAIRSDIRAAPFTGPWMENVAKEFQERNILLKTCFIPDQEDNSLSLEPDSVNREIDAEIREFHLKL